MERTRQFFSAILAGVAIGTGGIVFLSQESAVLGSTFFTIGLYTVVIFQLQLFTGKIGYTPFQKPIYMIEILITWLGNLVGTYGLALLVRNTRLYASLAEKVQKISAIKLADNGMSIFLLAICCGMLMFIAVDAYKNVQGSTLKLFGVMMPVIVFILCGFEHVVANMFYFSLAQSWDMHCFIWIIIMTLGNALGGMLIPLYLKIFKLR